MVRLYLATNGMIDNGRLRSLLGVSRQVATRVLRALVARGVLEAQGRTRGRCDLPGPVLARPAPIAS